MSEDVKAWAQPILIEGQRLRDLQPARDSKVLSISREYLLQQMGQLPRLCSPSTPEKDQQKRWDRYQGPFAGSAQGGQQAVSVSTCRQQEKASPPWGVRRPSLPFLTDQVRTVRVLLLPAALATILQPLGQAGEHHHPQNMLQQVTRGGQAACSSSWRQTHLRRVAASLQQGCSRGPGPCTALPLHRAGRCLQRQHFSCVCSPLGCSGPLCDLSSAWPQPPNLNFKFSMQG